MPERSMTRRGFLATGALSVGAVLSGGRLPAGDEPKEKTEGAEKMPPRWTILNHNERMSYRRLGKTGLWISAVSLGGHWKRCPFEGADFEKNRTEIMARCIDAGFNYVDACSAGEVEAYAKALKNIGKRQKIYFGFDAHGARGGEYRTRQALLEDLEGCMSANGMDYVDVWRITCHEPGGQHTFNESCEFAAAAETAIKQGKVRFFGFSTHDRRWADFMVREFPIMSVIVTPYTPGTNELAHSSFFETVRKHDIGVFGIKPFASNALFKGSSRPGDPYEKEDNEAARLALRHVLMNDAITSPIPGLIYENHVENCVQAIEERRKFDLAAAPAIRQDSRLGAAVRGMWDRLPPDYRWLKDWEYV
jgi:predicted aldo/keto reductase-like oxidoreductase